MTVTRNISSSESRTEHLIDEESSRHEAQCALNAIKAPFLPINWGTFLHPPQRLCEFAHYLPRVGTKAEIGSQAEGSLSYQICLNGFGRGLFDKSLGMFEVWRISDDYGFGEVARCKRRDVSRKINIGRVLGEVRERTWIVRRDWINKKRVPCRRPQLR